jgi:hypothetical protein
MRRKPPDGTRSAIVSQRRCIGFQNRCQRLRRQAGILLAVLPVNMDRRLDDRAGPGRMLAPYCSYPCQCRLGLREFRFERLGLDQVPIAGGSEAFRAPDQRFRGTYQRSRVKRLILCR